MRLMSLLLLLLAPLTARAQATGGDWTPPPPPLVPAQAPPMPPLEPPGALAPSTSVPGRQPTGYQYSPYGAPRPTEQPGPEVGLMVTESLFGMLAGAGVSILPFLMFFSGVPGMSLLGAVDPSIGAVLVIAMFAAIPMSVAQSVVSVANGSRFYSSEGWPAQLSGLAAEAAVLSLYFLTGGLPDAVQVSGGTPRAGGSTMFLFLGSIIAVPLVEMAITNLAKQPKFSVSGLSGSTTDGLRVGVPMPSPLLAQTGGGLSLGLNFSLVNVRF